MWGNTSAEMLKKRRVEGVMAVNNEEMVHVCVLWWGPFVEMTIVARSPRAARRCPE